MRGQWIGQYFGDEAGNILVDIDELPDSYLGYVVLRPLDSSDPAAMVEFRTADKKLPIALSLVPYAINFNTYEFQPWLQVHQLYPGKAFASHFNILFNVEDGFLNISWDTNLGKSGRARIGPSQINKPSPFTPEANVTDWNSFRDHVRKFEPYEYIFRGQINNSWRLRTSFHRTGRCNLIRYSEVDIQTVHKNLSARTRNNFRIHEPKEYGAFVSLIQHHGYPTPLLDWTHSPFVAAYFAFRGITNRDALQAPPDRKVRIFMFSKTLWLNDQYQILRMAPLYPHFSILDALAIENPRMIPQQAISSITNVDDIERYIRHMEDGRGKTFMRVFDIPLCVRPQVMNELAIMGATAGSLLPGLDGACEELRERFFE